jgi:hypothetical protein
VGTRGAVRATGATAALSAATGTPSGWGAWRRRPRFEVVYHMAGETSHYSAVACTVEEAVAKAVRADRYVVFGLGSGLVVAEWHA